MSGNEKFGKKIIIKGEMLHHVGFRPYLLSNALRLKIKNFEADNIGYDGKQVDVLLLGDTNKIREFANRIKTKKLPLPDTTKVIDTSEEEIDITIALNIADINEYREWLNVEQLNNIVQGGLRIGDKIDELKEETNSNFKETDKKYKLISDGMFAIVHEIEERNKTFENRIEKTEKNIEKTEKNIEKTEKNIEKTEKNIERLLEILEKKNA